MIDRLAPMLLLVEFGPYHASRSTNWFFLTKLPFGLTEGAKSTNYKFKLSLGAIVCIRAVYYVRAVPLVLLNITPTLVFMLSNLSIFGRHIRLQSRVGWID